MHQPVLLQEAITALNIASDGVYVDATFGRGGHSRAILDKLGADGRLIVFDRDPDAIAHAQALADEDPRVQWIQQSFATLQASLPTEMIGQVNGILLDVGVSSPQLDNAARGFSFRQDGPLDMRMDPTQGIDAATWLNVADVQEITDIIRGYGEERSAWRIAQAIVKQRAEKPLTTTAELAALVADVVPVREPRKHPATRTFQAVRMHVNDELAALATALDQSLEVLAPQGRLAVITFHSLEHKVVKQFMRQHTPGNETEIVVGVPPKPSRLKRIGRAQAASEEVASNPRARSARLHILEKIG